MASKHDENDLSMECAVCMEHLTNPKMLVCMHTFCERCLLSLTKKYEITCPSCRYVTEVKDGVSSLPVNWILQGKIETYTLKVSAKKGNAKCLECEEEKAAKYCTTCKLMLCEICATYHKRISRNKNHVITGIDESNVMAAENNVPRTCNKHNEVLKYFCSTCDITLCLDCTLSSAHKSHQFALLNEVMQEKVNRLQKIIQRGKEREKQEEVTLNRAKEITKEVLAVKSRSVKVVEECFEEIFDTLSKRKEGLINWLESGYEQSEQSVSNATKELTVFKNTLEYASELLHSHQGVEFIISVLEVSKRIEETIGSEQYTDTSYHHTTPAFDAFHDNEPQASMFSTSQSFAPSFAFQDNKPQGIFGTSQSGKTKSFGFGQPTHTPDDANSFKTTIIMREVEKINSSYIIQQLNEIGNINNCTKSMKDITQGQQPMQQCNNPPGLFRTTAPQQPMQQCNNPPGFFRTTAPQHARPVNVGFAFGSVASEGRGYNNNIPLLLSETTYKKHIN